MIVFLGNSGNIDGASKAEALFYIVVLVICIALFGVPLIWTILWAGLNFSGIPAEWGPGLIVCYRAGFVALVACVIKEVIQLAYEYHKEKRNNKNLK